MEPIVASFNFDHLYSARHLRPGEPNRYELAERIIREEITPHVLLAQEISATSQAEAEDNIGRLAEATNLRCELRGGSSPTYTVTRSNTHDLATGVLWHPDIKPVGWEQFEGFWHGFSVLKTLVNGVEVHYACYHGQPAGFHDRGDTRPEEAYRIGQWAEAQGEDALIVAGGDWNGLSADLAHGSSEYYDSRTVYENVDPGFARFVHDRTAGHILRAARLLDVAAAMPGATPQTKTDTEPPTAKEGPRRNDIFRVTPALMRLVTSYTVLTNERVRKTSDHFPPIMRHRLPALSTSNGYSEHV